MTAITSSLTPKLPRAKIIDNRLKPIPECLACLTHLEMQQNSDLVQQLTITDPRMMFGCLLSAHQNQLDEHYANAIKALEWFFLNNRFTDHLYVFKPLVQFAVEKEEPKLLWLIIMAARKCGDSSLESIAERFKLEIRFAASELFNLGIECNLRQLYFSSSPTGWILNLDGIASFDDGLFKFLQNLDQIHPIHGLKISNSWSTEHLERLFNALSGPKSIELHWINIFPIQNGLLIIPDHWKHTLRELRLINVNLSGDLVIDVPDLYVFIQDSPELKSITAHQADSMIYFLSYWWARPAAQLVRVRSEKATHVRVHGAKNLQDLHAPEAQMIDLEGDFAIRSIVALKCQKLCIPMFAQLKWTIHPRGKCTQSIYNN